MQKLIIGNKVIGEKQPVFFIAEAGVNHNGNLDMALELVDAAAAAGADSIKFQTFTAEKLNTRSAPKSTYHIATTGDDTTQSWFDLLKTQELNQQEHRTIFEYCQKKGILFLSTPYDESSADLLENLGVTAFKIASSDITNALLLEHIALKKLPMLVSTAMADYSEVELAVRTMRATGLEAFILLQCTGNYPSRLENSNLRVMQTYRSSFDCLVGYSDHTAELINPIAATAMGACVIEKHFTLDKNLPGPDHRMSLDPSELRQTIEAIRDTEMALGTSEKYVLAEERENRGKLTKSIVAAVDIPRGAKIERSMVTAKRPGSGIPPYDLDKVLGRIADQDLPADTLLSWDVLRGGGEAR